MKKEMKKNLISLTCALAFVAVGGGVALTQNHAKAEEINLIPENQMVLEEPEFRLKKAEEDENRNGLRFVVKAPNATELPEGTTETGTLVIPTDLLSGDLTVNTADVHKFVTTEAWNIYEDDGAYTYAYFWNMSEFSYNVEMTYRAYIVMGGETYYTETATTSLAEVALDFINKSTDDGEKAVADQFLLNYDVTFDVGASSTTVNAQQVKYGSKLTEVVTPELEGHTFNGWLLNGEAFDVENTAIKGDIELVADWKVNTYAVTFKDVDGDTTRFETLEVDWNTTATAPEFIALEPYKADALVWNTEDGEAFDFDTPITENTTLVAKRTLSDVIDFTTMTRLPSELMKSDKAAPTLAQDGDKQALKAPGFWQSEYFRLYLTDFENVLPGTELRIYMKALEADGNHALNVNGKWAQDVSNGVVNATEGEYELNVWRFNDSAQEYSKVTEISFCPYSPAAGATYWIEKIELVRPTALASLNLDFTASVGTNPIFSRKVSYNETEQALETTVCRGSINNMAEAPDANNLELYYYSLPVESRTLPAGTVITVYMNNTHTACGANVTMNDTYKAWVNASSGWVEAKISLKEETVLNSIGIYGAHGSNWQTIYVKSVTIELPQA